MVELPKTDAELQAIIDEKVKEATKDTISKGEFDSKFANQRKTYEDKIKDLENKLGITAEEKAKELAKQKEEELASELNELRSFKKSSILKERLTKEGLPTYFANDNRLITADEGDLDKVIKVVKGEYEATLPKGNTHSTVVQTNTSNPNANKDNKGLEGMADTLKALVS